MLLKKTGLLEDKCWFTKCEFNIIHQHKIMLKTLGINGFIIFSINGILRNLSQNLKSFICVLFEF